MNEKSEKQLKKETLSILGLSEEDDSEASFKASSRSAGLQKVLQQLPVIFESDDKFIDIVLKTYKKKLKPTDVMNIMSDHELKKAIIERYSIDELLAIMDDSELKEAMTKRYGVLGLFAIVAKNISKDDVNKEEHLSHMFKALANEMSSQHLLQLFSDAMKCKL